MAAQAELLKRRGQLLGALDSFDAGLPTPRRTQRRLGVQLQRISNDKLVVASAADENDVVRPGCVAEWNKLHNVMDHLEAKLRIQPGDRITAVNHSPDYISMLEEIDQAPRIVLSIERDRPGVLAPVPSHSTSRHVDSCKSQDLPILPQQPVEEVHIRRSLLPPLPPVKTQFGSRRPSISEGSTREPTPRKVPSGKTSRVPSPPLSVRVL